MKYSIEIGKIIEGSLKRDQIKVKSYTEQLISKLENDKEIRAANKFKRLLSLQEEKTLVAMNAENKGLPVPVDTESRATLADIVYPDQNNTEVILSQNNAEKLESFILSYKNADKLNEMGIGVSNSLLLYGPPGCGKTKCAYLISKKLDLPLVVARLDSLVSSYLGTTAKNIRNLFEFVQKVPCVLFLDEFDAIAKARDDSNELGELKRVVNSLLQNIDSMSSDSLLLAATNHHILLDSAVWRRFNYKLEIELPDNQAITKLIKLFTNKADILTKKDIMELAVVLEGLSGAEIEELITRAIRNSVIHNIPFEKRSIYEEFFKLKNITKQSDRDNRVILQKKAKYLRECNDKVFSLQAIADALGSSKTTIQKIVKRG